MTRIGDPANPGLGKLYMAFNANQTDILGLDSVTHVDNYFICNNNAALTNEAVQAWMAIHGPNATFEVCR